MNKTTRRSVLKVMAAGMVLGVTGCTRKIVWPVRGSDVGRIRLVFFTDVHARREWNTPKALALACQGINDYKADIAFAGGDLITDGFQSSVDGVAQRWDVYLQMHKNIRADLFPVIGNHDLVAAIPEDGTPPALNPRGVFLQKMCLERTYYSFDSLGYHFIVLDSIHITYDDSKYIGLIWPEEFAWLQKDLRSLKSSTPIIIITHMPLLTTFYAAENGIASPPEPNRIVVNNHDVLHLFKDRNLILVLQGHLHVTELHIWQNTTFITGGAICGKWWRGPWYGTEEGFNILTLSESYIDWEYVDYGWTPQRPINR